MVSVRNRFLMFVAMTAVLQGMPAYSQSSGQINGMVRDATAAGIPGATVTATNQATSLSRSTTTTNDGSFSISGLTPGAYTVSASLVGFRKVSQKDIQVAAGATARSEFTLEALLAEEITVTAMKREDTVANVPFSLAARTEEQLRDRGVED